jgi:hypothetical protein
LDCPLQRATCEPGQPQARPLLVFLTPATWTHRTSWRGLDRLTAGRSLTVFDGIPTELTVVRQAALESGAPFWRIKGGTKGRVQHRIVKHGRRRDAPLQVAILSRARCTPNTLARRACVRAGPETHPATSLPIENLFFSRRLEECACACHPRGVLSVGVVDAISLE